MWGLRERKQPGMISKGLNTWTICQDSEIMSSVLSVCEYQIFYIKSLQGQQNAPIALFRISPYQPSRNFWHLDSFLPGVTSLSCHLKSSRDVSFWSSISDFHNVYISRMWISFLLTEYTFSRHIHINIGSNTKLKATSQLSKLQGCGFGFFLHQPLIS